MGECVQVAGAGGAGGMEWKLGWGQRRRTKSALVQRRHGPLSLLIRVGSSRAHNTGLGSMIQRPWFFMLFLGGG